MTAVLMRTSFPTGSRFQGRYLDQTHAMDDFGTYHYPKNTTIYRGFFVKGRYHGLGEIRLKDPYKIILRGRFEDGHIVEMKHVIFEDRLLMNCTLIYNMLTICGWNYCTHYDRRFVREVMFGLKPVSSNNENLTANLPSRKLKETEYDSEEGVLVESNFLYERPPPLPHYRYVGCISEQEWIRRYCRAGCPDGVYLDDVFGNEIMKKNIEAAKELESDQLCHCKLSIKRYPYLDKVCLEEARKAMQETMPYEVEDIPYIRTPPSTSNTTLDMDSEVFRFDDLMDDVKKTHRESEISRRRLSLMQPWQRIGFQENDAQILDNSTLLQARAKLPY